MKRNDILENIKVEKLVFWGKGFARLESDEDWKKGRVLFITGWAIPGSVVNLRVIKKKKDFAECQITEIVERNISVQKSGGIIPGIPENGLMKNKFLAFQQYFGLIVEKIIRI